MNDKTRYGEGGLALDQWRWTTKFTQRRPTNKWQDSGREESSARWRAPEENLHGGGNLRIGQNGDFVKLSDVVRGYLAAWGRGSYRGAVGLLGVERGGEGGGECCGAWERGTLVGGRWGDVGGLVLRRV
ncbi:hypothetical protein Tco_1165848 [Tanacetum coccineum]